MPKRSLVYIIGAGRSGTTLLDILLGNAENTISLGEINRFFKRDGIPPKRNKDERVYLFWERVRLGFESKHNGCDYSQLYSVFRRNEYHTNVLRVLFRKKDASYEAHLKSLYSEIFERVDESVIIESSKYPLRALNLSNYLDDDEVEMKYIFIKKDPVKVVESFQQKNLEQPPKGFVSANVYYLVVNSLCTLIYNRLKRKHKCCKIKFEELTNDPLKTLSKIEDHLEIELETIRSKVTNNQPLDTGFLFDGNRIRLKESLLLQTNNSNKNMTFRSYFSRIFNYLIYRP